MKKYIVVSCEGSITIGEKVTEKLNDGFELAGNLIVYNGTFCQPMIKIMD